MFIYVPVVARQNTSSNRGQNSQPTQVVAVLELSHSNVADLSDFESYVRAGAGEYGNRLFVSRYFACHLIDFYRLPKDHVSKLFDGQKWDCFCPPSAESQEALLGIDAETLRRCEVQVNRDRGDDICLEAWKKMFSFRHETASGRTKYETAAVSWEFLWSFAPIDLEDEEKFDPELVA